MIGAAGPRRRKWPAVGALIVLGPLGSLWAVPTGWTMVQDELAPASAVAVLNGDHFRLDEAVAIYRRRLAPEIWLTQDAKSASHEVAGPIRDLGTIENCRLLMTDGIPPDATAVFRPPAEGTRAELEQIAGELKRRGASAVILITSDYHSRRVRLLWDAVVGDRPRAMVRSAPKSAGHYYVRERIKLAAALVLSTLGVLDGGSARRSEPALTSCGRV